MEKKSAGYKQITSHIFIKFPIRFIFIAFFILVSVYLVGCNYENIHDSVALQAPEPIYPLRPYLKAKTLTDIEVDSIQKAYDDLLHKVSQKRQEFICLNNETSDDSVKNNILDEARTYLIKIIRDELLPKWYGTTWEFEGHTNIPLDGAVACGYFVSTPLKHIGCNFNRYRMAQKYSHDIIKTLCDSLQIMVFNRNVLGSKLIELSARDDDIYIVGLDCHVGFITCKDHKLRFVHSNYLFPVQVVEEDIYNSNAFLQSELYVIGGLFSTETFVKKWILNDNFQ